MCMIMIFRQTDGRRNSLERKRLLTQHHTVYPLSWFFARLYRLVRLGRYVVVIPQRRGNGCSNQPRDIPFCFCRGTEFPRQDVAIITVRSLVVVRRCQDPHSQQLIFSFCSTSLLSHLSSPAPPSGKTPLPAILPASHESHP